MYVSRNLLTLDNVQLYNMIELSRVDCFNELKFEFRLKLSVVNFTYVFLHACSYICMYNYSKTNYRNEHLLIYANLIFIDI